MKLCSSFIDVKRFEQKFADLSNVDFSLFFEYRASDAELMENEVNFFINSEPNEYFGNHDWVIQNQDKFSVIFTCYQSVLDNCENAELMPYGESWLDDGTDKIYKDRNKIFEISHLRGKKLQSVGHQIRHDIFNNQDKIQIPKKFHDILGHDSDWESWKGGKEYILGDSQFSVVIENTSHNYYFTEKLTDCILMKTVPIYWGCPDIGKFYDVNGILTFNTAEEAIDIINSLTPETYENMIEYVNANYHKAFEYKNYITRIKTRIVEILSYNGLM